MITWQNVLFEWLSENVKFSHSIEIKNYVRGLFENYYPRIYEFIEINKTLAFDYAEVFVFKNVIALYEVIFSTKFKGFTSRIRLHRE